MAEKKQSNGCDILDLKAESPYSSALYNAPIPILIIQEDGRFLLINRAVQMATGFSAEEMPTFEDLAKHFQGDSATRTDFFFTGLFEPERALNPIQVSVRTKGGLSLLWEIFNAPLGRTAEGQQVVISLVSDMTEKANHERHLKTAMNRLEQEVAGRTKDLNATILALENEIAERISIMDALSHSRERLKIISRRTLDALEADRRTIAKNLHDSIGASLAAIKFSLEEKEMKRVQKRGWLEESLEQEISYLIEAIKETKRISANLRPTIMDDLGLMATIKWYLRQFQRLYEGIRIDFRSEIAEADIPETMKIIIYRIIQEGLNNAVKHGKATTVSLQMRYSDGKRSISLLIEDNGHGFDVEAVFTNTDTLSGYGLIAMRERCEIFGGSFHIESQIGAGTKIHANLHL